MTVWRRDPGVLWRRSGTRRILLAPGRDAIDVIDGPGALVWDLLCEQDWDHDELVNELAARHAAPRTTVDVDVRDFLATLTSQGAVQQA